MLNARPGTRKDVGEKRPCNGRGDTDPVAGQIEAAAVVACNAVEMRDSNADPTIVKVVGRPVRRGLCRRIPIHQVAMVDSREVCVTVATRNRVLGPAVVPDSVGSDAYRSRLYQLHPGVVVDVVNEGPARREIRIKVADHESPHCAVRDRIENGLAHRGKIDCLP